MQIMNDKTEIKNSKMSFFLTEMHN